MYLYQYKIWILFPSKLTNVHKKLKMTCLCLTKGITVNRQPNTRTNTGDYTMKKTKVRLRRLTKYWAGYCRSNPKNTLFFVPLQPEKSSHSKKIPSFNEMFFYWDGLWWSHWTFKWCVYYDLCTETPRFVWEKSANKNECLKHSFFGFIFFL